MEVGVSDGGIRKEKYWFMTVCKTLKGVYGTTKRVGTKDSTIPGVDLLGREDGTELL